MKKNVIFLISAILSMTYVNLSAQTEMNPTNGKLMNFTNNVNLDEEEGCSFRFVLENPLGIVGWFDGKGITVTVDGVEYGFVTLPWETPSAEETLLLPSGEVHFLWLGGAFNANLNYFEIYNSSDELIYTSPEYLPGELFFTYQNKCPECLPLTDFKGEYIPEIKQVNLNWTAPESVDLTGFDIFRNDSLIAHVAPTIVSYSDNTENLETGVYKYCVVPVYPFSCTFKNECFERYINNVGIKNYSSALQLYPNPAYNIVHIKGEDIANVKIYNSMGQLIKSYDNVNSVNVASYHAGIYFFNISTIDGYVGVYKVVVSK